MKSIFFGFITLIGITPVLSGVAFASDAIDDQLVISAEQRLVIEIPRGEVTLRSGTDSQVTVRGTLDPERKAFEFGPEGDNLVLRVRLPENWHRHSQDGNGSRLTIEYPSANAVAFDTISADLDAQGLGDALLKSVSGDLAVSGGQGNLRISSVSGDIEARQLDGTVALRTVSGDIELRESQGQLDAESVSGDLAINSLASEVALESVSGDIEAELGPVNRLKVRTVSGDQELKLATLDGASNAMLDSVSGDITLATLASANLAIQAETSPGGDIRNRLTDDKPTKSRYGNSQSLQLTLGSGQGQLRLNTVSGSLVLTGNKP